MLKTVEAIVEKDGSIRLLEEVDLSRAKRVLVTILDEDFESAAGDDTALLSEASLSEDWDREEEDEAWRHLQPAP